MAFRIDAPNFSDRFRGQLGQGLLLSTHTTGSDTSSMPCEGGISVQFLDLVPTQYPKEF